MRSEVVVLLLFCCSPTVFCSFFQVSYPNVNLSSEAGGNLIFEAGYDGNIFLKPGSGGSVFIGDVDLRKFVQKVKSLPPVWSKRSVHATLGTFYSGQQLNVSVEALIEFVGEFHSTNQETDGHVAEVQSECFINRLSKDPDGGNVTYSLISGHLPPGTNLNQYTGVVSGVAPDVDATYSFGIRATDQHGKYADGMFSIDIRERNQCVGNPCLNGGNCTDDIGVFRCTCPIGYGNSRCETVCWLNSFGVGDALRTIPNAQMSGHLTVGSSEPWSGRLGSSTGWIGNGIDSWLQVDLGETRQVYAVAVQGFHDATYHIDTYRLSYSINGNNFTDAIDLSGHARTFPGSLSMDVIIKQDLTYPAKARFVRFIPITWRPGGKPGFRVEIYGCPILV